MKFLISAFILLLSISSFADEYKPLINSAIKGSIAEYYPESIKAYKVETIRGFTFSTWAGKLYVMEKNKDNNMHNGIADFYMSSNNEAMEYAEGYCNSYFKSNNINNGYYAVDNFDVIPMIDDNFVRYVVTANLICYTY
jgi:hypothetical protein